MRKLKLFFAILLVQIPIYGRSFAAEELCLAITSTIGENPESAIESIGRPLDRVEQNVKNRYDDSSTDKRIRLEYSGGYISFYYVSASKKYLFEGAQLSRKNFNSAMRSAIPESENAVKRIYGDADERKAGVLLYYCGIEGNTWIELKSEAGSITGVNYVGYVD